MKTPKIRFIESSKYGDRQMTACWASAALTDAMQQQLSALRQYLPEGV